MGVAIAVATFIALVGMSRGAERAWTESLSDRGVHMLGFRKSAVEILSSTINQDMVEQIGRIQGVKAAAGELIDLINLNGIFIGVGGWPPRSFLWETLRLREGRIPDPDNPNEIVLGQGLADRLGMKLGDVYSFAGSDLKVVGISRQAVVLNESNLVLSLPMMQKLLGKDGKVSLINLRLLHPGDAHEVADIQSRLNKLFPDLNFLETKEATEASQLLQFMRKLVLSISTIALVMGLFFILNTMLMSVTERTKEIGILTSLGWRKARIMIMIMLEGLFLSAMGSALGLLAGILSLSWLSYIKHIRGFIDPVVSPLFLLQVFMGATILGMAGSFYPAWRTTRLRTVEAIMYE